MTIRKSIYALAVAITVSLPAFASPAETVYFNCDFTDGMPQGVSLEDRDGCQLHFLMVQAGFDQGDSWKVLSERDGNFYAGSPSMHKTDRETPADDRMTLPSILVRGQNARLSWRARCINEQSQKTGSFSVIINGEKAIDFHASPEGWAPYELSLDSYAGKRISICFVNNTLDGEILAIDDILVMGSVGTASFDVLPGDFCESRDELKVGVTFTATSAENLTDVAFSCTLDGVTHSASASGLNIAKGEQTTLWADAFPSPGYGSKVSYSVTPFVNGVEYDPIACETVMAPFRPIKRVVIEEGTGTWCGWCPLGMVATDTLVMRHGDRVIPVAVHFNEDPVAYNDYAAALGISGAPSGYFDRAAMCTTPMPLMGSPAHKEWYTVDHGGFGTLAEERLAIFPEGEISASAVLSDDHTSIAVSTSSRFITDCVDAPYKICLVLTEDNVWGDRYRQANYLSGFSNRAPIGGFDVMPNPIVSDFVLHHVARKVANEAFLGISGSLPSSLTAGEKYDFDYTLDMPQAVKDVSKLSVVAMILDTTDGQVVNAFSAPVETSGLGMLPSLENRTTYSVMPGCVTVSAPERMTATLTSISGAQVASVSGEGTLTLRTEPGLYILTAGSLRVKVRL